MVTRLNQLSVIPEGERYNRTFFLFGAISVEMPPDFVYNGFIWGMIAACNVILPVGKTARELWRDLWRWKLKAKTQY